MHLLPSVPGLRDPVAAEAGRLLRLLLLRLCSLPANTSGAIVLWLGEAGATLKLVGEAHVMTRALRAGPRTLRGQLDATHGVAGKS